MFQYHFVAIQHIDVFRCLAKRGNPSMPKAEEARDWTEKFVNGKIVKVKLLRKDQYGRVVGAVRVR